MNSRLLSAVLTGVHRAFPYVEDGEVDAIVQSHAQALFRLSHSPNFGIACVALSLLYQLSSSQQTVSERFYRALYGALLSAELLTTSKTPTFLALLFKAMKSDINIRRSAAFSKRLLQVAVSHPHAGFACGAMLLLSELFKTKKFLWNFVLQPADTDDVERIRDVGEDTTTDCDDAKMNGTKRAQSGEANGDGESSEEESDEKAEGDEDDDDDDDEEMRAIDDSKSFGPPSSSSKGYDMRKRDPGFCNADMTCEWELSILARHMHPSVVAFANALLSGRHIKYNGDPLRDMALTPFLDKFVARKPKQLKGLDRDHAQSVHRPQASRMAVVRADIMRDGDEFARLSEEQVEIDDVAFHRFYVARAAQPGAADRAQKRRAKAAEKEKLADPFLQVGAELDGDDDDDDDDDGDDDSDDDDGHRSKEKKRGDFGDFGDGIDTLELDEFAGFSDDEDEIDAILDKDDDMRMQDANVVSTKSGAQQQQDQKKNKKKRAMMMRDADVDDDGDGATASGSKAQKKKKKKKDKER